jgi:hypothetical protein
MGTPLVAALRAFLQVNVLMHDDSEAVRQEHECFLALLAQDGSLLPVVAVHVVETSA